MSKPSRAGSSDRAVYAPAPWSRRHKLAGGAAFLFLGIVAVLLGVVAGLLLVYSIHLPEIAALEEYRPSTITELYDRHGREFASFALERRVVVSYGDLPPVLRQAVISIEDKNFESHWGVNVFRVAGAALHDVTSGGRAQGASTLTMQLARNLFLSPERTFGRKLQEAFLAIQIERTFTKQQIFTLYANQIYLGNGVYGFEAGAEFLFSKHVRELTLPEAALLAGLPKSPVAYSPLLNPDRAFRRRNAVINAMLEDGAITAAAASAARAAPLELHVQPPPSNIAPWFTEAVRRELERRYGAEEVHQAGLRVDTTLDLDLQQSASSAVLDGLAAFERRHGWKGHLLNVAAGGESPEQFQHPDWRTPLIAGMYTHAVVMGTLPDRVTARIGSARMALEPGDWAWTGQKDATAFLKPGDIVYVHVTGGLTEPVLRGTLEQDSGAQGALLAVDNATGDILAMVGGRDFQLSEFNRATDAERQTGSSFKPFVYTAAVEAGATPGEMILDAPVTFQTANGPYTPHDYEPGYLGSIPLLKAFAESRNIPALRLAEHVGMRRVIDTAHRFGISSSIPPYLPVALGAVEVTLEQQVSAYSSFPNDGLRLAPRLVRAVTGADGLSLGEDLPGAQVSTDGKTARTMTAMLREVTRSGTGAAAEALHHPVGGKTGTTSNFTDAWFVGFSPSVTCGVWVGYDDRQSLGGGETGAVAALPIWMRWMGAAIAGKDDEQFPGEGVHQAGAVRGAFAR